MLCLSEFMSAVAFATSVILCKALHFGKEYKKLKRLNSFLLMTFDRDISKIS